jgi:DNA adenine methylase
MAWQVLMEPNPETGEWSATCPALAGFVATASTRDQALACIRAAIAKRRTETYGTNGGNGAGQAEGIVVYEPREQVSFGMDVLEELGIPSISRGANHLAFGWYGGKYSHLDWLLPLLPRTNHYCEPFGGSAAVLVNREPSPVETYNDLDSEVVNFFAVLRKRKDELIEAIVLTPFSREELTRACREDVSQFEPLERARRFYVRARQTRTGLAQTASPGRWATCRNTSRRGMGGAVPRWLGSAPDLVWIAARLLRVQIDNRPAVDVIRAYDSADTLFYCDPPYPHESRGDSKAYAFEMNNPEHAELAAALHAAQGKVAVSGYRCSVMEHLYGDWLRIDAPEKVCHSTKDLRQEALWVNYDVPDGLLNGGA